MKNTKGFTLVEVLLVVLILGVLASIVMPRIAESAGSAKVTECNANRANLISAIERYALNNDGAFPADQTAFDADVLNSTAYFPHGSPTCPYATAYSYDNGTDTVTAHSH